MPFNPNYTSRVRRSQSYQESDPLRDAAESFAAIRQRSTDVPVSHPEALLAQRDTRRRAASFLTSEDAAFATPSELAQVAQIAERGYAEESPGVMERLLSGLAVPQQLLKTFVVDVATGGKLGLNLRDYWELLRSNEEGVKAATGYDVTRGTIDLLADHGVLPESYAQQDTDSLFERVARNITNFGLDVLTDPLTYLSAGTSLIPRVGQSIARTASRQLGRKAVERALPGFLEKVIGSRAVGTSFADELLGPIAREAAQKGAASGTYKLLRDRVRQVPVETRSKLRQAIHAADTDEALARLGVSNLTGEERAQVVDLVNRIRSGANSPKLGRAQAELRKTVREFDDVVDDIVGQLRSKGTPEAVIRHIVEAPTTKQMVSRLKNEARRKGIDVDRLDPLVETVEGHRQTIMSAVSKFDPTDEVVKSFQAAERFSELSKSAKAVADRYRDVVLLDDVLRGVDAYADNIYDAIGRSIAFKDLGSIPEDLARANVPVSADELFEIAPQLQPGLRIVNPFSGNIWAIVPGTRGLAGKVTRPLREIRQEFLTKNPTLARGYEFYRELRTKLGREYWVGDTIRRGVLTPSQAFRTFEHFRNHPEVLRAAAGTAGWVAARQALTEEFSPETAEAAIKAVTRMVDVGTHRSDPRNVQLVRDRVLADLGVDATTEQGQAVASAAAAIASEMQYIKAQWARRVPDQDWYLNYHHHTLSEGMADFLNDLVRRGSLTPSEDQGAGAQLLSMILEGASPTKATTPVAGVASTLSRRDVGLGVFSELPIRELDYVLSRVIAEGGDAATEQLARSVQQSLEAGFLDVVTLNDLLEEPLRDFAKRVGVKVPDNLRVFEEDAFKVADSYAKLMANAMQLHDLMEYGKSIGQLPEKVTSISVNNTAAAMIRALGGPEALDSLKVKVERSKDQVRRLEAQFSRRKTRVVGRGSFRTPIEVSDDLLKVPEAKAAYDDLVRKANALSDSEDAIIAAQKSYATYLRKIGVPKEAADTVAASASTRHIRRHISALQVIEDATDREMEELLIEMVSGLSPAHAAQLSDAVWGFRTKLRRFSAEIASKAPTEKLPLEQVWTPQALATGAEYLEAAVGGAIDGFLAKGVRAHQRRVLRDAWLARAAAEGKSVSWAYRKAREAAEDVEEQALRWLAQEAGVPADAESVEAVIASLSLRDKRRIARQLADNPEVLSAAGDQVLSSVETKLARQLKEKILASYTWTDEQLERIFDLGADHFQDAFFKSRTVRNVVGPTLQTQIDLHAAQAASEFFGRFVDNTTIRLGGHELRITQVERVADQLRRGTADFTNVETQTVIEAWLRDIGVDGVFTWGDDGLKVIQKVEDLVRIPRHRRLVEAQARMERIRQIIDAKDAATAARLVASLEADLREAGLWRAAQQYVRDRRTIEGTLTAADRIIETHSAFEKTHRMGVEKGAAKLREEFQTRLAEVEQAAIRGLAAGSPDETAQKELIGAIKKVYEQVEKAADAETPFYVRADSEAGRAFLDALANVRRAAEKVGIDVDVEPVITRRAISDTGTAVSPSVFNIDGPALDGRLIERDFARFAETLVWNSQLAYTPEGVALIKETFRVWNRVWKAQATVWRPTFHLRNAVSGIYNSLIAGVGPRTYAVTTGPALKFRANLNRGLTPEAAAKAATRSKRMQDALLTAHREGIFTTTFVSSEFRAMRSQLNRTSRIPVAVDPRTGEDVISRAGGWAMEAVEDSHRFAVFYKHYNPNVPDSSKIARDMTLAVHFDYSNPTQLESKIKALVPFFVWTKNNIPLQLQTMLEQPRLLLKYQHLLNNAQRALSTAEGEQYDDFATPKYMPSLYAETGIVLNPGTPFWGRVLLAPDVPVSDILELDPLSLASWMQLMADSLHPAVNSWTQWSQMNEYGKVSTVYGRVGRGTRAAVETIFPAAREYLTMLGLERDPERLASLGVTPGASLPERALQSTLGLAARGAVGARVQTPRDTYSRAYEAQDLIRRIQTEARRRMNLSDEVDPFASLR